VKKTPTPTLPQPKILKELLTLRAKIQGKARRLGWKRYLAEMNERAGHLLGKPPVPAPAKSAEKPAVRPLGLARNSPSPRRTVSVQTS
jgi:hypothetical protein